MVYPQELIQSLQEKARLLRRNVVLSIGVGNPGHLGGSFSAAEIVACLYFYKMRHDANEPSMPTRDRFLLSKGHVAILQYSALAEAGYFAKDELLHTKSIGSMLQGHPDARKVPGIEACTGSLGQGLSIGLGMALGLRLDKIDAKIYVLIGDGELAEGQIWEAAMAASTYNAGQLVAIVDKNNVQAQGRTAERFSIKNLREKWTAFGWRVLEVDGHNIEEILHALDTENREKPTVIIANTVKGKGYEPAENHFAGYHNMPFSEDEYQAALKLFSCANGGEV
ncbi:MAG: transketolase [Defluviitaleaceae bacterium]|nr:transketolase [Defluviitaleaceae bacterium]